MRRYLVAGNWKMQGDRASIGPLLESLAKLSPGTDVDIAVCPPHVYLERVAAALTGSDIAWGGQDLSEHGPGAHTGETAAAMLADVGCRYVIVGHSERRAAGESEQQVAAKVERALESGLSPILCVGETLAERERDATLDVVGAQLQSVIGALTNDQLEALVIAYEPVWAIGSGRSATPQQAQEVHAFVRGELPRGEARTLLYGGSVKPENARELFAQPDIDGGLIGGASLDADAFVAICRAAAQCAANNQETS